MRLVLISAAALSLCACQKPADPPKAPDASTGAGGAITSSADPNPAGAGATTGATPGDATGSLNATPAVPEAAPTLPPTSPPPSTEPPPSTLPTPK